ncbi:vWA domain-containing protein [Thalassotalea aquiviva]|uniref:vWA domain-containing protein n=1 Tax=Thalassotalea aquiviva TaxID=3242415 RepID=UPI00352B2136
MKAKRRVLEEFSISFLDVICCGFGAIILLLMITKNMPPMVLEESDLNLDGQVKQLQEQLFAIRGESNILNRQLNAKKEQIDAQKERIAILRTRLATIEAQYAQIAKAASFSEDEKGKLALALQELTQEMERLLGRNYKSQNDLVGGIPVDSEYLIFIIDTSGSMYNYGWQRMIDEIIATLDIYPEVKGIQILNDMGQYMFTNYQRKWIPDTPARRSAIIKRLRSWNPFSNSSPVEGIQKAIRTFFQQDKKISLYVMGDEFSGRSIADVLRAIESINKFSRNNQRLVRIHAVGFPVQFIRPLAQQTTGIRFATLMRELTYRNGGTFVGLNDYQPN